MTDTTLEAPEAAGPPWWLLEATREEFDEYLDALPSDEHRLRIFEWIRAQSDWRQTPGTLAVRLDPTTVQTPALSLIDRTIVETIDSPIPATGGVRGTIISMPPQEGKTDRVSRRGTTWILQRSPDTRVAVVSYDMENARRVTLAIRSDIEIHDGEEGNVDLGLRLRKRERASGRWNLSNARGGAYAIGITGSFTGRPVDMLIIDDPVKDYTAADSELISTKTWVWWQSVARPRLAPGAPVIIVLTRWSDLDLAGRLIAKQREDEASNLSSYDRWRVVEIPAQADHRPERDETDPLGREVGEWMISARGRTTAQWEATKNATDSPRVWSALYQCKPAPLEGGEIKRKWFIYRDRLPERPTEWLSSWDMKLKDTTSGDYVVGGMWGRLGSKYYLYEVLRGQWDFATVQNAIALLCVRYPRCTRHIVENTGNGPEVMRELKKANGDYELRDEIADELQMTPEERVLVQLLRRRGISGLIPENPKGSKRARIRAYSGHIEAGDVILPGTDEQHCARWVTTFVDECAAFGVGGSYDDQVDMLSQALKRFANRDDDDEEKDSLQIPEGRIPKTDPAARAPRAGQIPQATRQAQILRTQLAGRKRETGRQ